MGQIKALAPHEQRVVKEVADLEERLLKLEAFLNGGSAATTVSTSELNRLHRQVIIMRSYRDVLNERIEAFTHKE